MIQTYVLIWKTQMGRQDCQRNQRCYKCQPSHCGEFHIRQLQTPIKFALFVCRFVITIDRIFYFLQIQNSFEKLSNKKVQLPGCDQGEGA